MGELRVLRKVLGMVCTNVYLAVNTKTKEAFLVDPADKAEVIDRWITQEGAKLTAILLTHGHYDHIGAVMELKKKYQVPVYVMEAEDVVLRDPALNLSGSWSTPITVKSDKLLKDREEFEAAGFAVKVFHTPGHTRGGACYYLASEKTLFSGDTIFCETIGRTDLPTGSYGELVRSVKDILALLPDDTDIYPGHEEETTVAHEKKYNPYVR